MADNSDNLTPSEGGAKVHPRPNPFLGPCPQPVYRHLRIVAGRVFLGTGPTVYQAEASSLARANEWLETPEGAAALADEEAREAAYDARPAAEGLTSRQRLQDLEEEDAEARQPPPRY